MWGPLMTEDERAMLNKAFDGAWYGNETYAFIEEFEKAFALKIGRTYAIMTPNATSALHLSLAALGIERGDEVIVPNTTWIGSVSGAWHLGASIRLADVDSETWCIKLEEIERLITSQTKAVIAVDLYGNMPDYSLLQDLCQSKNIFLVEDAAGALGSSQIGRFAGSFGVASVFSFHRTKTLSTGEGGMLLVDDEELYRRCLFLRDHGRKPGMYYTEEVAFKYIPSVFQAAIGMGQLHKYEDLILRKRAIYNRYVKNLEYSGYLTMNPEPPGYVNGAWASAGLIRIGTDMSPDQLIDHLRLKGIPSRRFFYPLHSLPAFEAAQDRWGNFPNSDALYRGGVLLPSALSLETEQIDYVCKVVDDFFKP